jgi:1-aminocyclopropane-1-carboxylate deaminase/D-cysteine desulfhydrase-like pyridoxal-dependent ACC family enzyme
VTSAIETIRQPPSRTLGTWPTPVTTLSRGGLGEILVKRDDLSGYGRGGVKTRKIESIASHLVDEGYTALATAVGNVTNLAHDLVPVLRKHGIDARILVADTPRMARPDRGRLFAGLESSVRLVGPSYVAVAARLARYVRQIRRGGGRAFFAPPSLAHPVGVMATAHGFLEMVAQVDAMDVPPLRTVFITAASGTTLAGFVLAENLLRRQGHAPIEVIGVQVYPGAVRRWVHGLIRWTEHALGERTHVPYGRIVVRREALHGGFGRYPPALARLSHELSDRHGLRIDPIFGAKTWSVMEGHLAHGRDAGSVLYWHCGYTPDWERLGAVG